GAPPAAVPPTRPVPVLATASDEGLLHDDEQVGPAGLLRVPSAALSAVEKAVADDGLPAGGFSAQAPPCGGGVDDREGGRERRPADRRLLRAGAALRGRPLRGRGDRDPRTPRAAP